MSEQMEQGARLEQLINALDETQVSFAQRVRLSQGYISQMIGGSRSLSKKLLQFIAREIPKDNVQWLLTGEGEIFSGKEGVPSPGTLDPQVMEKDVRYESIHGGIFESLVSRVRALEDRLLELEEELRALREGCGGKE